MLQAVLMLALPAVFAQTPPLKLPEGGSNLMTGATPQPKATVNGKEVEQPVLPLETLEAEYAKKPTPAVAYQLGQAYREHKRPVRAIEAFLASLRGPSAEVALHKSNAQRFIQELLTEVVTLDVVSTEPGVSFSVDGVNLGAPAAGRSVYLMPGDHTVKVEAPGKVSYKESISPAAGARVLIEPRLRDPSEVTREYAAPAPVVSTFGSAPARMGDNAGAIYADEIPPPPVYARWWFWTTIAVLAAGGVTAYVLYPYEKDPYCGSAPPCTVKLP